MNLLKLAMVQLALWLQWEPTTEDVMERRDVAFGDVLTVLMEKHGASFEKDGGLRLLEHVSRSACCFCNPSSEQDGARMCSGATVAEAEDADMEQLLAPLRASGRAVTLEQILKSGVTADMQMESSSLWREVASLDCLCTGYMERVVEEKEEEEEVEDDDAGASASASVDSEVESTEDSDSTETEKEVELAEASSPTNDARSLAEDALNYPPPQWFPDRDV